MARALVVDDSRAMRMILSRILQGLGFEILPAANGEEALTVIEREGDAIDVALVDWNMPGMNGLELVRRVRSQPGFARLRMVMVTTETEIEQMAAALEAGADEYIMKPFTPEAVEDKLRMTGAIQ